MKNYKFNKKYTYILFIILLLSILLCFVYLLYYLIKKYKLIYADSPNHIYTSWDVDTNYGTAYDDFKYDINNFWIDAFVSNTDCFNSKNYLLKNKKLNKFM